MVRSILEQVEALRDEEVDLCRSLVRINTVNPYSGDPETALEKQGQACLEPILRSLGADTNLFEPPADIYQRMGVLGPKVRSFVDRPNLVAKFDFGGKGPTLIVNGHMDTVGVSDMSIDPFSADVRDGSIWGRGACDCKGGLTAAITAIKALLLAGDELQGKIVFESVVDEECSGSGAGTLACCNAGLRGDAAIVVDGNDVAITLGCGGCLTADLRVHGRAGHAAHGGISAIDKGLVVKAAIDAFKAQREEHYPDAKVNLGVFNAGVHPAVVPSQAYLSLNIVYALQEAQAAKDAGNGWNGRAVQRAFEQTISSHQNKDPWLRQHPAEIEWIKDLIPYEMPHDAPLVQDFAAAFRTALGREPTLRSIPAWLDAAYFPHFARTPVVVFGPGPSAACHAPDEHVPIDDLVDVAKVLAVYLYRQLGP